LIVPPHPSLWLPHAPPVHCFGVQHVFELQI
jgi:hypothetical protein